AALVLDGAGPGLQEVGAEGNNVFGLGEIIRRELVLAEHLAIGGSHCLGGKWLIANHPAAQGADPLAEKIGEGPPSRSGDRNDLSAGPGELGGKPADGVVPGDLLELPVGTAGHGSFQPPGIVEPLERCLTPGAELALVDRVLRIAFQLDGSSLTGSHVQPAPRSAFGAAARVISSHARYLVFGLN